MVRRNFIGLDGFIEKSRSIHGDYYDYSKADYKDVKTKLTIICPKHGPFEQSPECHMKGYGCRKCAVDKRRQTMKERHGVEAAMQSDAILEKSRDTRKKKFGCQRPPGSGRKPMSMDEFLKKAHEIHGYRYDYSHVELKNSSTKIQIGCSLHGFFWQTPAKHLAGHGCSHPDCIRLKRVDTTMARYGVANAMQAASVRERQIQTNMERYGVPNPMQSKEVQAILRNSVQEKYGADCTLAVPAVREKIDAVFMEKYGGRSPMCQQEAHDKARATMLAEGGPEALTRPDMRGDKNPMSDRAVVGKMIESKIANGTCHTSAAEELLYERLCERFGAEDVVRQYKSDEYPYACDFFVVSRCMYVELNASWTHGWCWYEEDDDICRDRLSKWEAGNSSYYVTAIHTWTKLDIAKRAVAGEHDLNYVVFWDNDLRDADLWFGLGCPDGKDWHHMYSWLPDVCFSVSRDIRFVGTYQNLFKIAKHYQFDVFYARELALWYVNPQYKNVSLRIWLYHNRLRYLGKTPDQLSALEIARGFTISGILKGYTVFDTTLMDAIVQKYGIISVYDPCSGWGERALYCKSHGDLRYLGVDINGKLFPGYEAMRSDFSMDKQHFLHQDSAHAALSGAYQAVITCPPYGNTEIYSPDGAENLSEPDFIRWWGSVVQNSLQVQPEYFCFQVNTRWRDAMLAAVLDNGFVLLEELAYQKHSSSHFTRKNGQDVKSSKETMLVCRRVF